MTNAELLAKIKAEIERLKAKYRKDMYKSNHEGLASGYKIEAYNELLSFLSTLESEKPVPNDMEEAAEEYFQKVQAEFLRTLEHPTAKDCFIAGAKWQKEQDTREMIMSDGSYFQKCYELGKKDILSKFTKEHLEGLKWIERTGISTQPVPYHKYCKDLYKVLEELLKEKYDIQ